MERVKPVHLKTSDRGLELITDFEDKILYAYDDKDTSRPRKHIMPGDPIRGTLTIGSGHTRTVKPGDVIAEADRVSLLRSDVREAESFIHRFVDVPLSQCEFDGLVSLIFQQGPGRKAGTLGPDDEGDDGIIWLKSGKPSTLLKTLNDLKPDGSNYEVAAECFTSWRAPGSVWELGLTRRRVCEMLHFRGLPWKRAYNAIKGLPVALDALVKLAEQENEDLDALVLRTPAPPANTPTQKSHEAPLTPPMASANVAVGGGNPARTNQQASATNPEVAEAVRPGPFAAQPSGPAPAKPEQASIPPVPPQAPPKPAPPPRRPPDIPTPAQQRDAVNASQTSGIDWSSPKAMILSRRFYGVLLLLGGRWYFYKTGSEEALKAAADPLYQELFAGIMVMMVTAFVAECGHFLHWWGSRRAKRPLT